uniref:Uncharacterized protein n=1 Tax=Glycine max TaxID=3847 RepID=A0A0R0KLR6_SOYBN
MEEIDEKGNGEDPFPFRLCLLPAVNTSLIVMVLFRSGRGYSDDAEVCGKILVAATRRCDVVKRKMERRREWEREEGKWVRRRWVKLHFLPFLFENPSFSKWDLEFPWLNSAKNEDKEGRHGEVNHTTEGFEFAINKEASMVSQTIHSIEAACVYMAV